MFRMIIASLWLAFTFWANAPDAAAQEAAPQQQQQEYRIIPIPQGGTVSEMCAAIPKEERGDTIWGCAYAALARSNIENDRTIPVGMAIYLPVAPGYGSAQATTQSEETPRGFTSSLPSHEIRSPTGNTPNTGIVWAAGIMIIFLALLAVVIIAVAMKARRQRKESEMSQQPSRHHNGHGDRGQQPGHRMRDILGGDRKGDQQGQQRARSDREDEEEAPASTSSATERPQGGRQEQRTTQGSQQGEDAGPNGRTRQQAKDLAYAGIEALLDEVDEEKGRRIELEQILKNRDTEIRQQKTTIQSKDDRIAELERLLEDSNRNLRKANSQLARIAEHDTRRSDLASQAGQQQAGDDSRQQRPQ